MVKKTERVKGSGNHICCAKLTLATGDAVGDAKMFCTYLLKRLFPSVPYACIGIQASLYSIYELLNIHSSDLR